MPKTGRTDVTACFLSFHTRLEQQQQALSSGKSLDTSSAGWDIAGRGKQHTSIFLHQIALTLVEVLVVPAVAIMSAVHLHHPCLDPVATLSIEGKIFRVKVPGKAWVKSEL